jgi:hypothetical protein
LETLYCSDNILSFLDLTDCVALEDFQCSHNQFFEPIEGIAADSLTQGYTYVQQSISVAMSHDGQGGYVSELSFPRASNVTLSDSAVSFVNGAFVMPSTWTWASGFESYSGYTDVSGPVFFAESEVWFYVPFYAVTFLDYDGTSLETQLIDSGLGASAPAVEPREGYTFKGWDKSFDRITQDTTVTAVYEKNVDPTPVNPSDPASPGNLAKASDHMSLVAFALLAMSSFAACVVLGLRKKTQV